jgi:transcriptional regulator with XRE-family HTH domain
VKDSVGQKIRRIRKGKDLTQENMAYDLGITKGAYSKIENGQTNIPLKRLYDIAKVLEVDIIEFFKPSSFESNTKDAAKNYGFATKGDLEEIRKMIEELSKEVRTIKTSSNSVQKKNSKVGQRKK